MLVLDGKPYLIKEARQMAKEILHDGPLGKLHGKKFALIRDLFRNHPEVEDLGEKIKSISIGITEHWSGNKHRAFIIEKWAYPGKEFRYSYLKCFKATQESLKEMVTSAMREAIQYQIEEVRIFAECEEFGDVHHDPPFASLRDEWVFLKGGYDQIPIACPIASVGYVMSCRFQRRDWQIFHRENASLKHLTKKEHLKVHRSEASGQK